MESPRTESSLDHEDDLNAEDSEETDITSDSTDEDTEDATEDSEEPEDLRTLDEKLESHKRRLQQIKDGTDPEFLRQKQLLIDEYNNHIELKSMIREMSIERVEKDYSEEIEAATNELEEKKNQLKHRLIEEYENKRKGIGRDRYTLKLTGDWNQVAPEVTRKLRKRQNGPPPEGLTEKRLKPAEISFLLNPKEIQMDLKTISEPLNITKQPTPPAKKRLRSCESSDIPFEPKIVDGKLKCGRKFYHKGQSVFVDGEEVGRFPGIINNICVNFIWVTKLSDGTKLRIFLSQLAKRKIQIEERLD